MKEILESPPVLTAQTDPGFQAGTLTPQEALEPVSEEKQPSEAVSLGEDGGEKKGEQEQTDDKLKKKYEDLLSLIDRESKNEIPLPSNGCKSLLKDLFEKQIQSEMNKILHVKCVDSITFSSYNPVPPYRKMVGDIFYLSVKTLEGNEWGITCSVNGFYKNNSVEKLVFNPLPYTKGHPCSSYTLVGCLHQLSSTFGKNLEVYINSILKTEPYFLTQPAMPIHFWL